VDERRHIGRSGLVRRLREIDGEPGRTLYADGAAHFEREEETLVVRPPFGVAELGELDGVVVAPLVEELERDRRVGALLVRLGGYAVGVLEGERVVASKTGSRLVHGRHRAGGSSANRFRRRREEQARAALDDAAAEAARVLLPWVDRLDAVALGGDRDAVRRTLASRRDLEPLGALALGRFFSVPEPRRRVLEALPYDLYASEVTVEHNARP
jgi:peptide subunit release factor 1 (eRF1)